MYLRSSDQLGSGAAFSQVCLQLLLKIGFICVCVCVHICVHVRACVWGVEINLGYFSLGTTHFLLWETVSPSVVPDLSSRLAWLASEL